MHNLKEIMYIREKELLNLIRMKQKQLKTAIEGTLYANQHDNTIQFYLGISHKAKKYLRKDDPESLYDRMLSAKRPRVKPIREPDDEYVRKWLAEPYPKLEIEASQGEYPNYYNDEGVKMRSKSELIIADLLRKKRIPETSFAPLSIKLIEQMIEAYCV